MPCVMCFLVLGITVNIIANTNETLMDFRSFQILFFEGKFLKLTKLKDNSSVSLKKLVAFITSSAKFCI